MSDFTGVNYRINGHRASLCSGIEWSGARDLRALLRGNTLEAVEAIDWQNVTVGGPHRTIRLAHRRSGYTFPCRKSRYTKQGYFLSSF